MLQTVFNNYGIIYKPTNYNMESMLRAFTVEYQFLIIGCSFLIFLSFVLVIVVFRHSLSLGESFLFGHTGSLST